MRLKALPNSSYCLHGAKTFASGTDYAARPLLTEALPDSQGQQILVLAADVQPLVLDRSSWPPLGIRPTASHHTDLNGLEIGPDDVLGPPTTASHGLGVGPADL